MTIDDWMHINVFIHVHRKIASLTYRMQLQIIPYRKVAKSTHKFDSPPLVPLTIGNKEVSGASEYLYRRLTRVANPGHVLQATLSAF